MGQKGREKEAMAFFEAACTLEMRAQSESKKTVQPRYRSKHLGERYGLPAAIGATGPPRRLPVLQRALSL